MTTIELYYSETCHECHRLRTLILDNIPKNMRFKEINIAYPEGKSRANELNILSVPTVVINGEVVSVGRISKEEFLRLIREV